MTEHKAYYPAKGAQTSIAKVEDMPTEIRHMFFDSECYQDELLGLRYVMDNQRLMWDNRVIVRVKQLAAEAGSSGGRVFANDLCKTFGIKI